MNKSHKPFRIWPGSGAHRYLHSPLALAIATSCAGATGTLAETSELEEMIVTAVKTEQPLNLVTDPKKPRQPLPANDGADYLKTIPGFSVIRKGGTDGDAVLRGMAGSRLSMVLDGESILGGCSSRMDPPTAYIFPETLDQIKVIKGPQTVKFGPGNSAGVILFERNYERPDKSEWDLHASLLAATADRQDGLIDAAYKSPLFTLRGTVTSASADNYQDGDGVTVHSRYERWNSQLGFAWTPDDNTRLELNSARSDGAAAYADRGVDGSRFARENVNAKFVHSDISDLIQSVEVQGYYNYVDHVMDNYTLRESSDMMAMQMAMNPDRKTTGGKLSVVLIPQQDVDLTIGLDAQQNRHSNRNSMNQSAMDYRHLDRVADAEFTQTGVFTELNWEVTPGSRWVAGARVDDWNVRDLREQVQLSMMSTAANPTAGQEREALLHSGFTRFEKNRENSASSAATFYAGVGYTERFPDYWEIIAKETADSLSALDIEDEKTTQLDIGYIYRNKRFTASVSVFANTIDDYLMIQSGYSKMSLSGGMGGMGGMGSMDDTRSTTIVRNIDARTWGAELDLGYRLSDNWRSELTLSSVRGANESDGTTLAQLPPLETRLSVNYEKSDWSAGVLWRSLAAQDRVDIGKGNIAGQDFGPTDAANILSLNGGWRATQELLLTAGIDNLLDATYAEHISRAGVAIPGFDQLTRVNEPGRTLWIKAVLRF
ncbi:TonB-dependent copper receptor [Microbulbifer bruguierae]|uniref:TonB-dependent copper receptor n=1 Tax=Microbulbifer bruguierae TaxID=3029061 RepID=A0ABY8N9K7_9GAMM|nr:TonB-dependent copper receptor [Microbulbifer bruguierae]WGL15586.1 TonB-dependent copper receptor [Microbulbifer bruguierae]